MNRNEDGVITAFVAIFAVALLLVGGLVVDGGSILAARRTAIDEADGACHLDSDLTAWAEVVCLNRCRE